jgi:hypothetical protein
MFVNHIHIIPPVTSTCGRSLCFRCGNHRRNHETVAWFPQRGAIYALSFRSEKRCPSWSANKHPRRHKHQNHSAGAEKSGRLARQHCADTHGYCRREEGGTARYCRSYVTHPLLRAERRTRARCAVAPNLKTGKAHSQMPEVSDSAGWNSVELNAMEDPPAFRHTD